MQNQEDVIKEIVKSVKKGVDDEKNKNVTRYQFYFETALYEKVFCSNPDKNLFDGVVDAYNSMDGFDTTYSISYQSMSTYDNTWSSFKRVTLSCKRGGGTILKFIVAVFSGGLVMKIGQHPSLADIQFAEIDKKYNYYLSKEDLKNYKKAIGLFAHGVGAGSFVYLRRIFENLVLETYNKYKEEIAVEDSNFKFKRMDEKIDLLKKYLPSQLIEMKSLYGILSNGVHELSEDDCLDYFSPIKLSITLILDQKIERSEKEQKDALVKKELQEINQKIKQKSNER